MIPLLLAALLAPPQPDWIERVYALPPEIAASLLLEAVARHNLHRPDLIEDAFRFAARAQMRYPEIAAVSPESAEARRVEASFEHLDALTLQTRAVQAMMRLAPARALELALEIPVPSPPRATCGAPTLPSLNEYYGLALQMAQRGFPARQRLEGRHLDFLLRIISSSTTTAHLAGAASLVQLYPATEEELPALLSALATAFRSTTAHPREAALLQPIRDAVAQIATRPGGETVKDAFDAFERSLGDQEPCPDNAGFLLWKSGAGPGLRDEVAALRNPSETEPQETRYLTLLHRIESWQGEKETPVMAHFHMKSMLYRELLDMAPSQAALAALISSFVQFLDASPAKTLSPAEWIVHFRRLLLPWAPAGLASVSIARAEIRRTGDPVMNLLIDAAPTP